MSSEEQRTSKGASENNQQQADDEPGPQSASQLDVQQIQATVVKVITDPVGFYQNMPREGGFIDPLIFMVVMAVITGLLSAVLSLFGMGMAGAMTAGLMAVVLVPVFVVIFGFVGAAIFYVIWMLMGSRENFETAYRCVAYTAAVAPITMILSLVPYLGSLVSSLWPMALLALASIHVHKRGVQISWVIFGAIGIIYALISVGGERASRQLMGGMEEWQDFIEQQKQ